MSLAPQGLDSLRKVYGFGGFKDFNRFQNSTDSYTILEAFLFINIVNVPRGSAGVSVKSDRIECDVEDELERVIVGTSQLSRDRILRLLTT